MHIMWIDMYKLMVMSLQNEYFSKLWLLIKINELMVWIEISDPMITSYHWNKLFESQYEERFNKLITVI